MCFYLYRSAILSNRRFGIFKIQNYKTLAEYFIEGLSSRKQFDSKCNMVVSMFDPTLLQQ